MLPSGGQALRGVACLCFGVLGGQCFAFVGLADMDAYIVHQGDCGASCMRPLAESSGGSSVAGAFCPRVVFTML